MPLHHASRFSTVPTMKVLGQCAWIVSLTLSSLDCSSQSIVLDRTQTDPPSSLKASSFTAPASTPDSSSRAQLFLSHSGFFTTTEVTEHELAEKDDAVLAKVLAEVLPGTSPELQSQDRIRFIPYQGAGKLERSEDEIGSTNVPMDSWIYPALERLAAMGFITTQNVSIRPWTRKECLRQLREVYEHLISDSGGGSLNEEATRLTDDVGKELAGRPDGNSVVLESAYTRYGVIAGPALTDSTHFGQTWWNDFGRPLGRGGSVIAGFSARAAYGRFFLYDRQEVQQSPGTLTFTTSQREVIAGMDGYNSLPFTPPPFPSSSPAYLRQRPLEFYAGVAFGGNALTFGKQELYWGPTTIGPLSFSSNAEPTYNLRLLATRPHPFPLLSHLGTYRFDLVFGKLSGHKFPARPYYNGEKLTLNFGGDLELGFTRWSVLWGVGHPMTLGSLKRNLFSADSTGTFMYNDRTDPGDRKSGFDFRLHVPGLRKLVTIYADSYADDELNPISAPRRVVWSPGIYFARLPFLTHMDFRVEMASSEELSQDEGNGTRFFFNGLYRDSNTNKGFFLGNAVGRDGRVFEARSNYWFSARSKIEAGYRQNKGSINFTTGGSTVSDAFINASYAFTPEWTAQLFTQYERFLMPAFMAGRQQNESGWLQITWNPKLHVTK
jgi:hypothetical protein